MKGALPDAPSREKVASRRHSLIFPTQRSRGPVEPLRIAGSHVRG